MEVYFLKKLILHRSDIRERNESQNIKKCSEAKLQTASTPAHLQRPCCSFSPAHPRAPDLLFLLSSHTHAATDQHMQSHHSSTDLRPSPAATTCCLT